MDDLIVIPEVWVPLAAAFIPLLAAAAVRPEGANVLRAAAAIIAAGGLAALEAVLDGDPDTFASIVSTFGTSVVAALTAYHAFWAHLGVNTKAGPQGVGAIAPEPEPAQ